MGICCKLKSAHIHSLEFFLWEFQAIYFFIMLGRMLGRENQRMPTISVQFSNSNLLLTECTTESQAVKLH